MLWTHRDWFGRQGGAAAEERIVDIRRNSHHKATMAMAKRAAHNDSFFSAFLFRNVKIWRTLPLAIALTAATSATLSADVVAPPGWTLSHVGAAHCGRYALDEQDGPGREGIVWCEWPGEHDRIRLNARCRSGENELATEGDHDKAAALSRQGQVEAASRFPFDTERILLGDYIAHCEGRRTRVDALPILDNDPSIAWVEHLSGRPGGCRWFNIAPVRSDIVGPKGGPRIVFDARTDRGKRRRGVPVLLAECCTGEPGGPPAAPLSAFINIDSFPGDPEAAFVTNPLDWLWVAFRSAGDELFYDKPTTFKWRADARVVRETTRLTRSSVTWSTRTSYKANVSGRVFADVFRDGGEISMTFRPSNGKPGVQGTATFRAGARTRKFVNACAALRLTQ